MAALLRTALQPNLVQTLEGTPALVHGGPFGNIAHGCNSVVATRAALRLADIVITEAGFGADLGAEKFIDIKCRASGLRPQLAVLVATVRALKLHGGAPADALDSEDLGALARGLPNLERHLHNLRRHFGLRCVVAINRFPSDTPAELAWLSEQVAQRLDVPVALSNHFADGGAGALELAQAVLDALAATPAEPLRFAYDDADSLWDKARAVATRIYGAADIAAPPAVRARLDELQAQGCASWPVCIAKTQYSFSTDPTRRGAPSGHVLDIREVRLAAGARFVVLVCGDVMTMPGLPKVPSAERIDVADDGQIVGLR
jgi:formate--tetrahydrofolate ligase